MDFELIHYTDVSNLPSIMITGILDQKSRSLISGKTTIKSGEGDFNRKCGDPLTKLEKGVKQEFQEACGVYFRVRRFDQRDNPEYLPKRIKFKDINQVALVFKSSLLEKYKDKWHINLCENNGFYIYDNYVPYGDCDEDFSFSAKDIPLSSNVMDKINKESEIIIYSSVPIDDNLVEVVTPVEAKKGGGKHKRSKHKRSKHKRSKHKRSKHTRTKHNYRK